MPRQHIDIPEGLDLDALEAQTTNIVDNLHSINDDGNDLEALEEQTSHITTNLDTIELFEREHDLDTLEAAVDRVIEKLERIKQLREETGETG
jgi:hypothetical protein